MLRLTIFAIIVPEFHAKINNRQMIELSEKCSKDIANKWRFGGKRNKNLQVSEFLFKTLEFGENPMLSSGVNNGSDSNWSLGDELFVQRRRHYRKRKWSSTTHSVHYTLTVSLVPLKEAKLNWKAHRIWRDWTILEPTNLIRQRRKKERFGKLKSKSAKKSWFCSFFCLHF